jgi:hypothetical protein
MLGAHVMIYAHLPPFQYAPKILNVISVSNAFNIFLPPFGIGNPEQFGCGFKIRRSAAFGFQTPLFRICNPEQFRCGFKIRYSLTFGFQIRKSAGVSDVLDPRRSPA